MAPLLDVANLLRGVTYMKSESSEVPFSGSVGVLRASNIVDRRLSLDGLVYVPRDLVSDNQMVRNGDVVVATSSGSVSVVGKGAQARSDLSVAFGAFCGLLRPAALMDAHYFGHYFSTEEYRGRVSSMARGVNINNLKRDHFASLSIPLPPLTEQKRIAEKLDALLARVDDCRERLARIPGILKRFRQSLLGAATSGELTADWREARGLTVGDWRRVSFADVCREITVGHVGKMIDQYQPSGVPFLRSLNVRPFRFDATDLRFISPEFHALLKKSALRPGDVVVVRTGAPGQCCVVPPELPEANCSDLVIVRPGPELDPGFAAIFINSEASQSYVRAEQVGVAQAHFNVGSMKRAPLWLPGIEEQREIVSRVVRLLADADRTEASHALARRHVERVTPALLAKAFRGELVEQEPDDEPASVLLERIRSARVTVPSANRALVDQIVEVPTLAPVRPSLFVPRIGRRELMKTRNDLDVKGKPYLSDLVRFMGERPRLEQLYRASDLSLDDFYKQLAWEVEAGHLKTDEIGERYA